MNLLKNKNNNYKQWYSFKTISDRDVFKTNQNHIINIKGDKKIMKKNLSENILTELSSEAKKYSSIHNYGDSNYGSEEEPFNSMANTEIYDNLKDAAEYFRGYSEFLKSNSKGKYIESSKDMALVASKIEDAIDALENVWSKI
jgi:S-adenosylmethionine hydrolase